MSSSTIFAQKCSAELSFIHVKPFFVQELENFHSLQWLHD
jgi:hypothetical protein